MDQEPDTVHGCAFVDVRQWMERRLCWLDPAIDGATLRRKLGYGALWSLVLMCSRFADPPPYSNPGLSRHMHGPYYSGWREPFPHTAYRQRQSHRAGCYFTGCRICRAHRPSAVPSFPVLLHHSGSRHRPAAQSPELLLLANAACSQCAGMAARVCVIEQMKHHHSSVRS